MKSLEKETKAEDDLPDVLCPFSLCIEHEHCACCNTDRSNPGHIERDQDTRDRCTDICAEYNAGRLREIHDPRIDEAHRHDGRRRGRLNTDSDQHAHEESHDRNTRQLLKKILHL